MIELAHAICDLSRMSIFAIGFFLGCVFCTCVAGWIWMSLTKGTKRKPSDSQAEKAAMKFIRNSTDNPSQ